MMWWTDKQKQLIKCLEEQVANLIKEKEIFKSRCKDLEDGVEKDYGIKIRNEVTEVKIDFDKMEMSVLYAALCKLMTQNLNTDDLQYYLNLRIKIENTLDKMKG